MTLTRGTASVVVRAVIRGYKPDELVNDIVQGDRQVTISNAEILAAGWPGPPGRSDTVVIDGETAAVLLCDTRRLRGTVAMHIMQVRI